MEYAAELAADEAALTTSPLLRVLLVDPSLFTAPYDAALTEGLREANVVPGWAVRALRANEEPDLKPSDIALPWYRFTDGKRRRTGTLWKVAKGVEHAIDLLRLRHIAAFGSWDVVHFQWAALPWLDVPVMRRIARHRPLVLTVHDTTPFNGADVSQLQVRGFDTLFHIADRLIVHTEGARYGLIERGVPDNRIAVIPHGPLKLRHTPQPVADRAQGRWRIVLFGRLQTYKGLDTLIEALGLLAPEQRQKLEVVVAGEPLMDVAPLIERAAFFGLTTPTIDLRLGRLSDQETADLLGSADAFVFPYHAIEASGVLFLVNGLGKWIVASRLGAFIDMVGEDGTRGALVAPGDAASLAEALIKSIGQRPNAAGEAQSDWPMIGARTAAVYRAALDAHDAKVRQ